MGKHFHRIYIDDINNIIEKIFSPYLKTSSSGLDPICISIDTTTPFEKRLIIEHNEDRYEPRLDVSPYY